MRIQQILSECEELQVRKYLSENCELQHDDTGSHYTPADELMALEHAEDIIFYSEQGRDLDNFRDIVVEQICEDKEALRELRDILMGVA